MAQHDYVIANGTGAAVRSDLNNGLAAIVSNNSGATEPGTMYAYQWWADTTTGLLKQRNSANNAWVTVGTLASANLGLLSLAGGTMTGALAVTAGTAALPGIAVSGDLNTGITSPGADQLAISTGGTSRLAVSTTAVSSTLAVDVPLGAVGTPSLTFTGDLNTGVFSPGADTIALVTGGTNRVHVTSGGLVGIGTTAPAELLELSATTDPKIQFTDVGNVVSKIGISASTALTFEHNGSEAARIDSSSRLLVGTSTASGSAILQVAGDLAFNSGYGSVAVAYGCRAWVNFNGTGTVAIRASGNVSSITDNGTGDYTVNFTTALANVNYAVLITGKRPTGATEFPGFFSTTLNVGSVQIGVVQPGISFYDSAEISVAIFR